MLPDPPTSSVRTCLLAQRPKLLPIFWAAQGQEHGLIGLGRAFHIMVANLSEGSSREGDWLSPYCIVGRSQHKIVLLPSLALLWALLTFLVSSLPRLNSLSCLLLLRTELGAEAVTTASANVSLSFEG